MFDGGVHSHREGTQKDLNRSSPQKVPNTNTRHLRFHSHGKLLGPKWASNSPVLGRRVGGAGGRQPNPVNFPTCNHLEYRLNFGTICEIMSIKLVPWRCH